MRLIEIEHRLRKLEAKKGISAVTLTFADGSTRSVQLGDALAVCIAAMKRVSWRIATPEETPARGDRKPFFRFEGAPRPASNYDGMIDLIGSAEEAESTHAGMNDPFIGVVHGVCREAVEEPEQEMNTNAR